MEWQVPTLADVLEARRRISAHLRPTPLYRYIHSGNEPLLIAGVATETLEIMEEQPAIDVIVVPVGGGSGAACGYARSWRESAWR